MLLSRRRDNRHSYYTLPNEAGQPLHVLGLGPSARSFLFGTAALQCWDPAPEEGAAATYRGHRIGLADEARSFLVHHLRDADNVTTKAFSAVFGKPLVDYFPEAVAAWVKIIQDTAYANTGFAETCTPGYYNNEGKPGVGPGWFGGSYGGGAQAFFAILREWRESGELEGLDRS